MLNLAEAAGGGHGVEVLFIDYGQIAAEREKQAAREQCEFYSVKLETVELPWYRALLPPVLRRGNDVAKLPERLAASDDAAVWAPNRNGLLVAVAAAFAEAKGVSEIVAGFNAEEAATFPDNSPEFIAAYNELLKLSTSNAVKLESYTAHIDKKAIVKRALELDAPLGMVYSCYSVGPKMCGRCVSCSRLKAALEANDIMNEYNSLFTV
jgi:7-cyano-7-deazaguanine synthase